MKGAENNADFRQRSSAVSTVGIDVGGRRKGFHAVALSDGQYSQSFATADVQELMNWCRTSIRAVAVSVDAPCRWSTDGHSRPAERQAMNAGIWCFSTPTRQTAVNHRTNHYGWMLRGEELFQSLEPTYRLCTRLPAPTDRNFCCETYPHAITWQLTGGHAVARRKRKQRRTALTRLGIDIAELTNIDLVDAALCAFTAYRAVIRKDCVSFGEANTGIIIVPAMLNP